MGRKKINKSTYEPKYKKETINEFTNRLHMVHKELKENPKFNKYVKRGLFVISPNRLLTSLLEVYTSHWPRDVYKSIDGVQKLHAIRDFLAEQEMILDNELLTPNSKNQYGIMKLLDQWFNSIYMSIDNALDENETIKQKIEIKLNGTGLFDNGNKD